MELPAPLLDTTWPTSVLIEATVPPNGAVSVVPVTVCWSSWTTMSSLVTAASSCAVVVAFGVADSVFDASVVW